MTRAIGKADFVGRGLHRASPLADLFHPGGAITQNMVDGKPLTGRNLLDPDNAILQPPPAPPPPAPVFPDVMGAELNARRAVRKRAVSSGVGSTVLTGGYSPTGQASPVLGGG